MLDIITILVFGILAWLVWDYCNDYHNNADADINGRIKEHIANVDWKGMGYDMHLSGPGAYDIYGTYDTYSNYGYPGYLGPWWASTRRTRNMSYDLRGDVPLRYYYSGPWWQSSLY